MGQELLFLTLHWSISCVDIFTLAKYKLKINKIILIRKTIWIQAKLCNICWVVNKRITKSNIRRSGNSDSVICLSHGTSYNHSRNALVAYSASEAAQQRAEASVARPSASVNCFDTSGLDESTCFVSRLNVSSQVDATSTIACTVCADAVFLGVDIDGNIKRLHVEKCDTRSKWNDYLNVTSRRT